MERDRNKAEELSNALKENTALKYTIMQLNDKITFLRDCLTSAKRAHAQKVFYRLWFL